MFYSIDTLLLILGIISILLWLVTAIKYFKKGAYNPFGYSHPFELILIIIIVLSICLIENKIYSIIYSIFAITIIMLTQTFISTKMYLCEKKLKYLINSIFILAVYSFLIKCGIERIL